MYIDFMDTLRQIKNGIFPQISQWKNDVYTAKNDVITARDETLTIKEQVIDSSGVSNASSLDAQSYSNENEDVPVKKHTYDPVTNNIVITDSSPAEFSAKHYSLKSQGLARIERWEAEAAKLTASSFATEPINNPVKVFTSNGDGTFTENTLDYVFSALHYRNETELLSGQKRWVETVTATAGQTIVGFTKNINTADVYLNGIRQTNDVHFTILLKDITFLSPLNAGDIVTVSGMEAITSSEFSNLRDETKQLKIDTQLLEWETKAQELTAQSYTSEPENSFVKIFTSNGDGTFSSSNTSVYSALHWSKKMNLTQRSIHLVNTYADLALVNVADVSTVYVRGGYSIGDGRDGIFYFDSSKSNQNNGGTIIDGWVREFDNIVQVSWFNVVADGITDDSIEIQKAIDAGSEISFGNKTYAIASTLNINNKKILCNSTIINATFLTGKAISVSSGGNIIGNMIVNWIDTNKGVDKTSFELLNCSNSIFELSSNNGTTGIKLNSCNDCSITIGDSSDNTICVDVLSSSNNKFNINTLSQTVIINASDFNKTNASFINVDNASSSNRFIGGDFTDNINTNDQFLILRNSGSNTYFSPNNVVISNTSNIFISDNGTDTVYDIEMTPNLFASLGMNGKVGTISYGANTSITTNGINSVANNSAKTIELKTNSVEPTISIDNASGEAISVSGSTAISKEISVKRGNDSVDVSASNLLVKSYKSSTDIRSSVVSVSSVNTGQSINMSALSIDFGGGAGPCSLSTNYWLIGDAVNTSRIQANYITTYTASSNSQLTPTSVSVSNTSGSAMMTSNSLSISDGTNTKLLVPVPTSANHYIDKGYVDSSLASKEPSLGNPLVDGQVLSSTATGIRTWVNGGIGIGQTWKDLTLANTIGTVYTNNTGGPIQISITTLDTVASSTIHIQLEPSLIVIARDQHTIGELTSITVTIPDGVSYSVQSSGTPTINNWAELS